MSREQRRNDTAERQPLKRRVVRMLRERRRVAAARRRDDATVGWPNENADEMQPLFEAEGIAITPWRLNDAGYRAYMERAVYPRGFLGGPGSPDFTQRSIEHYAVLALTEPTPSETVLDIGSNMSPLVDIVRSIVGCECYEQDLQFPPGVDGWRIGGDAAAMPVSDGFADVLLLCSAYPHFEGDADMRFVVEAARVLRPGGRAAILPLYLSDTYGAKADPRLRWDGLLFDEKMHRYLIPGLNVRFSRSYDPGMLLARVLQPARAAGLDARVLRVQGGRSVEDGTYLDFALVLTKQG
ncbi:MAG: methyltransferase domain-containing protein [Actinomycetota bacterium]